MPRSGTGVVWPALADHQDNPLKASRPLSFRLLFPFGKGGFSKEFFMPRCGATFDENSVPPWTRGDFRGVLGP